MPQSGRVLRPVIFACATAWAAVLLPGPAAADEGAALYKKHCKVCHTVEKGGAKRQGPNLWGVIGRTAGKVDGFPYSKGLKSADWAWDSEIMDKWLEKPKGVVSDTYMIYRQKDPEVRRKIIAYLGTRKDE